MSALTERQVAAALRERFPAPAWAFFEQVRNGTGYQRRTRTADALALSLWPSRGIELHGFEVKVSRADWKRELEQPDKAEEIARFCSRWWLAVGDASIVQPGELPASWGLLVPKGEALVVKVEAPAMEAQPLSLGFVAALLRRIHEVDETAVQARVQKALGEQLAKLERAQDAERERAVTRAEGRVQELEQLLGEFSKASGINLLNHRWDAGRVGEAVRLLLRGGLPGHMDSLERLHRQLSGLVEQVGQVVREGRELDGSQS